MRAPRHPVLAHALGLTLALLLATIITAHAQAQTNVPDIPQDTGFPMGLVVNGQESGCSALVARNGDRLFLRRADLAGCAVPEPAKPNVIAIGEEDYVALDGLSGLSARLDGQGSTLLLDFGAENYGRRELGFEDRPLAIARSIPAAWIEYEFDFAHDAQNERVSSLINVGLSGRWGVLTSSALAGTGLTPNARLDTAYTLDFPERRLRLVVGDSLSDGASWSEPIRFGGLHLGTDFSLDPMRLTYPLPVLQGGSALPSTVSLATGEGQRAFSAQPGLFSYAYRPRFNGAGDVTMTVRDIAGTMHEVTRSFYLSTSLLRPGLSAFSLDAGWLRHRYGLSSFAYGPAFASARLRHGLAGSLTLEGQAQASGRTQGFGLGGQWVIQPLGEIRLAGALSRHDGETGSLMQVQAQRITHHYGVTASYRRMDANYRQVGEPVSVSGPRQEFAVSANLNLGKAGTLSAGQFVSDTRGDHARVRSVTYSLGLGPGFLTLGAQWLRASAASSHSLLAVFTMPLGVQETASIQVDDAQILASYDKAVPTGPGLGYRAALGQDRRFDTVWAEGRATWRTALGDLELAGLARDGVISTRASARGAIVAAGGTVALTRQTGQALAIVDLSSETARSLQLENRPVAAASGLGGKAIVPNLVPFVPNRISVDPAQFPIEVPIDNASRLVVPGWNKAVEVSFTRRQDRSARVVLETDRKIPLEVGLTVEIHGQGEVTRTILGYGGEIFLRDYPGEALVRVLAPAGAPTAPSGEARELCRAYLGRTIPSDALGRPIVLTCSPWIETEPLS